MESQSRQELKVELIQTTTVFNKILNTNCTFDGSNIVYLAGSNIAYHNVFQNNKHFRQRLNENTPLAIAFHKSPQVSIALVTKVPSAQPLCLLEFYESDKQPTSVQLHEDITVHDAIFIEKRKVCILCHDNLSGKSLFLIVSNHRKFKRVQLDDSLVKFCYGYQRILFKKQGQGCLQFNTETEELGGTCYSDFVIKQVLNIEESQLVITQDNHIHVFLDGVQTQDIRIKDYCGGEWGCGRRVGRNIMMAFKNQMTLGHFQWSGTQLNWIGSHQYSQRLKANIICMHSSVDEMNMALAVQIFHKDTWIIEHFIFNLSVLSSEKKFINAFTRLSANGAEAGDALSMQRVISSQMFLLSGSSIVNYSYIDHIQKKHKYVIPESPRLIAVHPLGYQIMCTFEGSIKFYQKVEMDLVEIWTQGWNCTAAKYTESGLLMLAIYDEGIHQLLLYNPNSFTRLKVYSQLYLKHSVTSIDLDQTQTDMVLLSGKDLSVYKVKTGEKISEFRQKRQGFEANCVQYDTLRHLLIVGGNKRLSVCKKGQDYLLNFSIQKHFKLEHNITCIIIRESTQMAFLGTSDGKVLIGQYPFQNKDQHSNQAFPKLALQTVRVHSCPTTDLLLSNNGKFLFAASKGEGLAIMKIRKNGNLGNFYNSFDISNYNFIQTSSKHYLQTVQDKLKVLLQKRKAIFNELDQFKKEWQAKRQRESKTREVRQKKLQLLTVNAALKDIGVAKAEQDELTAKLNGIKLLEDKMATDYEEDNHQQMIKKYAQNDTLKGKLAQVEQKCRQQFQGVLDECKYNLGEIDGELREKYQQFEQNYNMMKRNLLNYALKVKIEQREQENLNQQEIDDTRTKLRKEQNDLYRKNNQLKAQITRNKKQLQRYLNRRDFLENKQRFFCQELNFCATEEKELHQIKQELQNQLKQMQECTEKKQKRLRKYFLQNQMLLKYQMVHSNLSKTTEREVSFIQDQHYALRKQINQLQKEILTISDNRTHVEKEMKTKQKQNLHVKQQIKTLKNRGDYLQLQIKELQRLLSSMEHGKQHELQGLYERFFVHKRLEGVIECQPLQQKQKAEAKKVQIKIKQQLQDHKAYLVNNMNIFQKCNSKVFQQIQTSYLKHQSENYALIGQCNMRKEQISKKKRVLQEMCSSMRQTENCIQQIHNGTFKPGSNTKVELQPKIIPFVEYQKKSMKRQKSEPSLFTISKHQHSTTQVRMMLDVQKCTLPESRVKPIRRIQTACIKKRPQESINQQVPVQQDCGGWFITKPQTAKRRGAQQQARRLFSRNKSRSKPTTCTSHSKYSAAS